MRITAEAITQLRTLSKRAGVSIEQYVSAISVQTEHENALNAERRSSPVSKEAITRYLSTLNGELGELSKAEVCQKAGVPHNQGNASFVRHEVKRLLAIRDQREAPAAA